MPRGKRANPKHPIDRGAPASVIAEKFGGLKAFTDALSRVRAERDGEKPMAMSTVHRWLVRGTINGRDQDDVMAAARHAGAKVKPADFVDTRPMAERSTFAPELASASA